MKMHSLRSAGLIWAACAALFDGRAAVAQVNLPATIQTPFTWDWNYEADMKPDQSGAITASAGTGSFIRVSGGITSDSAAGGIYQASTINSNIGGWFTAPSSSSLLNIKSSNGYTFEWRAKVLSIDEANNDGAVALTVDEGTPGVNRFWKLGLMKNGLGQYSARLTGDQGAASAVSSIDNNFHTYRVTVINNSATLYVDGGRAGTVTSLRNLSSEAIEMGDVTSSADGTYATDYLRATSAAAVAPSENLFAHHVYQEPGTTRRVRFAYVTPLTPETQPGTQLEHIFYQISGNNGSTYDTIRPLVQSGSGFNSLHPITGVTIGKNGFVTSQQPPWRASNGEMIVPYQFDPLDANGNVINPYDTTTYNGSGLLIGKWINGGTELQWELGQQLTLDPNISTRGLLEPAAVELRTPGKFLMVMRGSNETLPNLPSRKWKAVSTDFGRTWGAVDALTYSDGGEFFSPSASTDLRRNSKDGKVYWFGNLIASNANGNSPRYPLNIAEVDEALLGLVRGSLRTIVDRDPVNDTDQVQFSNFNITEDPNTGAFIIGMYRFDPGKLAPGQNPNDPGIVWPYFEVTVPLPQRTWIKSTSGDWNASANWSSNVPNAPGATALLATAISSAQSIYTNTAVTVGSLTIDSPQTYVITGAGSLNLQASVGTTSSAAINVVRGSHKIDLPLNIISNTTVDVSVGASLAIADPMTLTGGTTLTKEGAGSLILKSTVNAASAATLSVNAGTLDFAAINSDPDITIILNASAAMTVDYQAGDSPISQLRMGIANGLIATDAAGLTIGYGDASVLSPGSSDPTLLLVKPAFPGDATLDALVGVADLDSLALHWQGPGFWPEGDFNHDGLVNLTDLELLALNWGDSVSLPDALMARGLPAVVVPEPASMIGVALLVGMVRRSRQKRSVS
jgi:hypothetical protein